MVNYETKQNKIFRKSQIEKSFELQWPSGFLKKLLHLTRNSNLTFYNLDKKRVTLKHKSNSFFIFLIKCYFKYKKLNSKIRNSLQ